MEWYDWLLREVFPSNNSNFFWKTRNSIFVNLFLLFHEKLIYPFHINPNNDNISIWNSVFYTFYQLSYWENFSNQTCSSNFNQLFHNSKEKQVPIWHDYYKGKNFLGKKFSWVSWMAIQSAKINSSEIKKISWSAKIPVLCRFIFFFGTGFFGRFYNIIIKKRSHELWCLRLAIQICY